MQDEEFPSDQKILRQSNRTPIASSNRSPKYPSSIDCEGASGQPNPTWGNRTLHASSRGTTHLAPIERASVARQTPGRATELLLQVAGHYPSGTDSEGASGKLSSGVEVSKFIIMFIIITKVAPRYCDTGITTMCTLNLNILFLLVKITIKLKYC